MTSTPSRWRISAIASATFMNAPVAASLQTWWSRWGKAATRQASTGQVFDPQGPLTHDCRSDQMTPLMLEVVDAAVEQETVVPDEQRVLLPFHAAMVVKVLSQALQIV